MADILSLKEAVLVYLDRSGGLRKLVEDCKPFNDPQQIEAVYRFCISVNPSDVIELDPALGDCVLHNPLAATALFKSVNVILKLTHLPPFPEYTLDLSSFPRGYGPVRPVSMEGLVIALTRVTKYTQGARFLCINDDCPCSTGFHHIRVHAPGATESATVGNNFSCMVCSSPLKEDVKFRVLGDKQLVELIHVKALDGLSAHQQSSLRYQSVTLFLRDPHKVSSSFQELLKFTAGSPWRFSAVVAHFFGSDMAPPGLYHTLKLGLLLSLVQTKSDEKNTFHNLDLLVVTTDTLIPDRLMMYSLGLACRGVRHQASGEMFASLSKDQHGAGTANIHAGSALLATGGICMLGDLGCYKKDRLDAIQSVLESCTVSVFIPGKKYGEDADQQLSFPVQCSFWALTESTDASRRSGRADCAILGTALVAHAQSLQVELTPEAEKIIHGYYMASRRVRTQSQGVKMSVASIKLLDARFFPTGASALVIPPDAVFPCDPGDVDGLHNRDVTLDELHQNILRFIYAYAPGADTYITEE
ncbi:MCM domain-containing protein 2 [Nibea albiflora]|uniref:MCM domain-containing protein 2 n=1 Tax=Nibea albiflora TaxID=240163 RepID=A0ACB7F5H3_NIBAL|nr:MCM domain-containing protein 2 [Nibea albiflora]